MYVAHGHTNTRGHHARCVGRRVGCVGALCILLVASHYLLQHFLLLRYWKECSIDVRWVPLAFSAMRTTLSECCSFPPHPYRHTHTHKHAGRAHSKHTCRQQASVCYHCGNGNDINGGYLVWQGAGGGPPFQPTRGGWRGKRWMPWLTIYTRRWWSWATFLLPDVLWYIAVPQEGANNEAINQKSKVL